MAWGLDYLERVIRRFLRALLPLVLRPSGGDLVRLGSRYGGWWVPRDALVPGAVAYCGGVGEDASFDLTLFDHGLRVVSFDPTPRAITYMASLDLPDSFTFLPIGWWDEETELPFYAPRDPSHVSHSALNLQGTDTFFLGKVNTVAALARELGDDRIDILKMDIEGAEIRVIESILTDGPWPRVLCIEFDQPQPISGFLRAVRSLRNHGYSVAKVEDWNVTFLRQ